jgi:hypothetical protein
VVDIAVEKAALAAAARPLSPLVPAILEASIDDPLNVLGSGAQIGGDLRDRHIEHLQRREQPALTRAQIVAEADRTGRRCGVRRAGGP